MFNIILPTYNEKENIKPLFYMINKVFKELKMTYKIILIDDGSPDGTLVEAIKYKENINVELISRKEKLGLGTAYKEALRYCEYNYIIIMDADLSHNPYDIKKMIQKMNIDGTNQGDYDIVIGSRYLKSSESGTVGWNFKRKLTSRGANNLAQIILGTDNTDLTGSFRLYKKCVFEALIENIRSKGYAYQMEILYLANLNNFSIGEVPIIFHERISGESKLGTNEIVKFVWALFFLFFKVL